LKEFSNLAKIVYRRTYSREKADGKFENWNDTCERVIAGNVKGKDVPEKEIKALLKLLKERKAGGAGRNLWFSGAPQHDRIGGRALTNCWFFTADKLENYVIAMDLLLLGGGVGLSVENRFSSKLPKVKKTVTITHKPTKDADFIIPDSREGWCKLLELILEAYFETGKSFSYSTICIRGRGEKIGGFGGYCSGPISLVAFVDTLCGILNARAGKSLNPIDAADILTTIGELVVSGNVRRSATIIIGDCYDKDFLKIKRFDLGTIPPHRSNANYSVVCDDIDDLHPLFWKTYEFGEPLGIVNRKNIQKYGRMGELKKDTAIGTNPCVPAGTEILTKEGYIPIEQLVGTTTDIWNGSEWSSVTPMITGHNQPLVTVILNSGQSLTCTPTHKFIKALDYKGTIEKCDAINLEAGDKLIKGTYPVVIGGSVVDYAYTQGFISADGMDDYTHLSVYDGKEVCIPRMSLRYIGNHTNGRTGVYFSFAPHSKTFVPFTWSIGSRLDWFAGLCDGDGTVLIEGGIQICSINRQFLLSVQKLLTTLGCPSKVCSAQKSGFRDMPDGKGGKREYFCQDLYRLMLCSKEVQKLVTLGLHCERLKLHGFEPNRSAERFPVVVDVIDSGVADIVYCFTEPKKNQGCFEGIITGQCAEATLESGEPCNLTEIVLPNLDNEKEFIEASRLMHRYAKRVTLEEYHHDKCNEVIKRNRRVGCGITGCLMSPLFNPESLDKAYQAIQEENISYSKELGIPPSIRTTVVKPSGTWSKLADCMGYDGIHAAYSHYIIQRIRFDSTDKLVAKLKEAGHNIAPEMKFDGSVDHNRLVVDFYMSAPEGYPVADGGFSTWQQLDTILMAQKNWADQSVSTTVYYKKADIPAIKEWLSKNLCNIKTISFLLHSDHGFVQAPKEAITKEQFEKLVAKIKPISEDEIEDGELENTECLNGSCPIK
jgi:ribonucleotide reductase alpha subunit